MSTGTTAPVLTAQGLAKSYGPRVLFSDLDLAIGRGERVGLVGDNGAGKSTLAKILGGVEESDAGEITLQRGARVAYLHQAPQAETGTARQVVIGGLAAWTDAVAKHAALTDQLSASATEALIAEQAAAAEEVERLGGWHREQEAEHLLDRLGLANPDAAVSTLSGGERRRVDLARLLISAPDLAILDEPTNHLDIDTIEWLEKHILGTFRGALLVVTHDRYLLERIAKRTLELDHGRLFSYAGGWSSYLEGKGTRLEQEAREEKNRRAFLRTEMEWLRRSPSARRTKQKARIQRAEAQMTRKSPGPRGDTRLDLETTRLGNSVLTLKGVELRIPGRTLVKPLDLLVQKGDRLGILGKSGAGKSTLLRAILGERELDGGNVRLGKHTSFAYFDQERSGLDLDKSVQDNIAGGATKVEFRGETVDVRSYMARFLFDPPELRKKASALSGGERARVVLAKLLLTPANVLVFDEPTNDLDVSTLGALEELITEANATAIIVSHDRYFLDRVATSILAFEGEGQVVRYVGDYSTYVSLRDAQKRSPEKEAKSENTAAQNTAESMPDDTRVAELVKLKPLTGNDKRELEGLPDAIEKAETALAKTQSELSDPALYSERAHEVESLLATQSTQEAEVERLMDRWAELEARAEANAR